MEESGEHYVVEIFVLCVLCSVFLIKFCESYLSRKGRVH